ncbi:hypothetical protein FFWV33_02890 [Flavobacterium faecale]|uniref:Outer membrane protein beta-barrel domain-containing protein n=1 Tax=Flavobacterium faecale TaxID=1355330 RepID=A0A2S1L9Z3_9FLAO|nr:hypothetical protein [Flavobacterium faecale]AWG20551.1 hypothetical protein FFWV33_02890 [Flavobacterium faecale]
MKKTILTMLLLSFYSFTNAQITKGNWMVGGDANYTNSKIINNDNEILGSGNTVRIFPNIGYFIANKFALGINGNFNYGKANNTVSNIVYGGGPFARYYFLKPENRINLLAEANYNYYSSKTQGFDSNKGSSYRFKAGPVVYFNSSVGLEMTLNYLSESFSDGTAKYFTVGFGFQIHLEKQLKI